MTNNATYFGVPGMIFRIPAPQSDMGFDSNADVEQTQLVSGGRLVSKATTAYKTLNMSWSEYSPALRPLMDALNGQFNVPAFYVTDPSADPANVLPPRWSNAWQLAYQADGWCRPQVNNFGVRSLVSYVQYPSLSSVLFTQYNATLQPPALNTPTTATAGGTLGAGTYFYVVTALNALGETLKSNEVSVATTGTTSKNTLTWGTVTGATGYKVYRSTATGTEKLLATVGNVSTYADTGSAVGTVVPPTTSTAYRTPGYVKTSGVLSVRVIRLPGEPYFFSAEGNSSGGAGVRVRGFNSTNNSWEIIGTYAPDGTPKQVVTAADTKYTMLELDLYLPIGSTLTLVGLLLGTKSPADTPNQPMRPGTGIGAVQISSALKGSLLSKVIDRIGLSVDFTETQNGEGSVRFA